MPLDYSRLRTLTAREIVSALLRDGFRLRRHNGAHRVCTHPDRRRVTVSFPRQLRPFFPIAALGALLLLKGALGF